MDKCWRAAGTSGKGGGYAFLSSQAVRYLRIFLNQQKDIPLILIISGAFLVLAFLARNGKNL